MKDDGAQRILKSVKLLWDVQPKAIESTTPRADPNNNRPLRGDLQLSAISSVAKDVPLCCRVPMGGEAISGVLGMEGVPLCHGTNGGRGYIRGARDGETREDS